MDTPSSARRPEDIALDLLKFVASTANVVKGGGNTPGFVAPNASKADDYVTQLLDLYTRCRKAVEAPLK